MGGEAHHWTTNIIKVFCKRDVNICYDDTESAIYGDAYHGLGMARRYYIS